MYITPMITGRPASSPPQVPSHLAHVKVSAVKQQIEATAKAVDWSRINLNDDTMMAAIGDKWWNDGPSYKRWITSVNEWSRHGLAGKVRTYWSLRNHPMKYLGPGPKYLTTLEFCELFETVVFCHILPIAMREQDKDRIEYIRGRNRVFLVDSINKLTNATHHTLSLLIAGDFGVSLKDARKKVDDTLYILESKGWVIRKHDKKGPYFVLSANTHETERGTYFHRRPLIVNDYRVEEDQVNCRACGNTFVDIEDYDNPYCPTCGVPLTQEWIDKNI